MTILATSLYRQGVRLSRRDGGCCAGPGLADGDFVWIDLADPTPADLLVLQSAYDLSPLAVMEAMDGDRHCRCERLGELYAVNVPAAPARRGEPGWSSVAALLGPHYIVTIAHGCRRDRRPLADTIEVDADPVRLSPEHILHAFLSETIGEHDRLLSALREEVTACGQQALTAEPVSGGRGVASRLWVGTRSIAETLHRLCDMLDDVRRYNATSADETLQNLFSTLSDRVAKVAQSADELLQALETTRAYLDHKSTDSRKHGRTMLAASLLMSVVLLLATRLAADRSATPALGLAHLVALTIVVLCTTMALMTHLNRRSQGAPITGASRAGSPPPRRNR
ncbi:CorA family divalent cation transporter [uncultured Sphingomonas sp.]|uniref:CorA family divalent cation transporter n=1 Tax=uncultured Sphingomonas sp. TaxID=158754 RepID=UPI0035C9712A